MWLLKDSTGNIFYLKPNKTYSVGRKQADIILDNDQSISRCHASLEVSLKDEVKTNELLTSCIVKDSNSKYGTYINRNGVQIKVSNQGYNLEPNDTVKFGLQHHNFQLEYINFMTLASKLSEDHKKKLKDVMDRIGGIVVDNFNNNCTHLTATMPTTTNKIITALVAGLPIVSINYWISVEKAIDTNKELPDPNNFTLSMQDKNISSHKVSLKPNPERRVIFKNKTFIFFSQKTHKIYKTMIEEAAGKVKLLNEDSKMEPDTLLADNILIQGNDRECSKEFIDFYASISSKLQEKKLRLINETEIPLAIIYVSLEQYCNPKFQFKKLMQRKSHLEDKSKVLAADTQDILPESEIKVENTKDVCIPESDYSYPSSNLLSLDSESQSNSESKNNYFASKNQHKNTEIFNKNLNEVKSKLLKPSQSEKRVEENVPAKNFRAKMASKISKSVEVPVEPWKNIVDAEDSQVEQPQFIQSKKRKNVDDDDDNEKNVFKKKQKQSLVEKSKAKSSWTTSSKRRDIEVSDGENDEDHANKNVFKKSQKATEKENKAKKGWLRNEIGLSDDEVDIAPSKKQKTVEKSKDELSSSKFEFKKARKEVVDFDLDDLDDVKPVKISVQSKKSPQKVHHRVEKLPSREANKLKEKTDKNLLQKNIEEDKVAWVRPDVCESKESIKLKTEKLSFLRDLKEFDLNCGNSLKTFKKSSYYVPDTRISFAK